MDAAGGMPPGADWQSPGGIVETLAFGTREPQTIDTLVDTFCRAHLHAGIDEVLFRASSVGVVYGVRLGDGRRAVVKALQPDADPRALRAVHRVQTHLSDHGFPCPAPLVAPTGLGRTVAVAEALVDEGEFRDTHDSVCRRLMAETLAWHLELCQACGQQPELRGGWSAYSDRTQLWPAQAHSPILNFARSSAGAEWIDTIAAAAKRLMTPRVEPVVGHHDWSGKHFRFDGDRVTVVYDWDSLQLGPEAVIVGNAAMTFTANFDLPALQLPPSPEEVRAFVDEYSIARARPLSRDERTQIAACATFIAAYTARCEHAHPNGYDPDNSFTWALRTFGEEYLRP